MSGYLIYQVVEWLRFRDSAQGINSTDWPSRDISDFMYGLWVGPAITALVRRKRRSLNGS